MSRERSSLTFILKLDAMQVNLLLYIHSNKAGKNVTTKTFSTLDSDPGWKGHPPPQDILDEPTFLTFLWKTRRTVYMQNSDLARLELEGTGRLVLKKTVFLRRRVR